VVVAIAGVLALVALLVDVGDESDRDAVADLVEAYGRSRHATYRLEGEFSRTMPDGRRLASAVLEVQRPPDRLHRRLGSASGRIDGRWLNCSSDPDGRFSCAPGAEAPPWDEVVGDEIATLGSYFEGEPPRFHVRRVGEDCFELIRAEWYPPPPHGVPSQMCFDPATGALRRLVVEHEGGVMEVTEAIELRADVGDADFRVSDDPSYAMRESG
jgi:hypothetical protein